MYLLQIKIVMLCIFPNNMSMRKSAWTHLLICLLRKALICKGKDKKKKKKQNKTHNYSLSAKQMSTVAEKGEGIYSGKSITHGGGTVTLVERQPFDDQVSVPRKIVSN